MQPWHFVDDRFRVKQLARTELLLDRHVFLVFVSSELWPRIRIVQHPTILVDRVHRPEQFPGVQRLVPGMDPGVAPLPFRVLVLAHVRRDPVASAVARPPAVAPVGEFIIPQIEDAESCERALERTPKISSRHHIGVDMHDPLRSFYGFLPEKLPGGGLVAPQIEGLTVNLAAVVFEQLVGAVFRAIIDSYDPVSELAPAFECARQETSTFVSHDGGYGDHSISLVNA